MTWEFTPGMVNVAALSYSGHYVISHRQGQFCLRYRPKGQHAVIGDYKTLSEAKSAAQAHNALVPVPDASQTH